MILPHCSFISEKELLNLTQLEMEEIADGIKEE